LEAVGDLLQRRLAEPLPGREGQFQLAPRWRIEEFKRQPAPPADAKVACVLLLLHYWADAWRVVLIKRSENPNDRHSGQVSFPGGRYEESDGHLSNVALRETEEEIGIDPASVRLVGRLTELYIPVSYFLVHPFVGVLQTPNPVFLPQPGEVEHILMPELELLTRPEVIKTKDLVAGNGMHLKDVPYFDIEGRVVWGATSMILSEFLAL
jgi:8-oxo-dGTP pyrophosphatase MutT (NUDIX family)